MREAERFRSVMGRFVTGVTVVTGTDATGRTVGLTANAFTSVSLDPPLILICVSNQSISRDAFLATGRFAVSVLGDGSETLARRFAGDTLRADFSDLPFRTEVTGAPVLDRQVAWLDCRIWDSIEAGDHTVIFGRVEACGEGSNQEPLVFYQGRYRGIRP